MVPPIEGITITSENVKNLTDEEMDTVVTEKQQRLATNLGETKETTKEHLLNKPNMTAKDKEGMQKAINFLVGHVLDTPENFKKLDAIVYTSEYINIGGVKRARDDISAKPDGKYIFQHNDVTCFKWNEDIIKQQNDLLSQQDMEIPSNHLCRASIESLPIINGYEGGNILALITNMSDYYCNMQGDYIKGGYRWVIDGLLENYSRVFKFDRNGGEIIRTETDSFLPIRPVFK